MKREEAIHELQEDKRLYETEVCHAGDGSPDGRLLEALDMAIEALSADAVQRWILCSERLPKINQRVLLATNEGRVFVGYKEKPDIVWRVTEADGREHWVYDPENYTDDIDVLPKDEDCGFAKDDVYADGFLSVTSINYDDRFEGVVAWMPLPEPYKAESEDKE